MKDVICKNNYFCVDKINERIIYSLKYSKQWNFQKFRRKEDSIIKYRMIQNGRCLEIILVDFFKVFAQNHSRGQ